jgi:predicted O-methyltransferase YrrM
MRALLRRLRGRPEPEVAESPLSDRHPLAKTADDLHHLARELRGHRVYGWCRPEQGEWYAEQVASIEGGTVVEVGVYAGMSISYIADVAAERGTTVYAVDPWERRFPEQSPDWHRLKGVHRDFTDFVAACDLGGTVKEVAKFSEEAAADFADGSIDLAYIDGGHTYEHVQADLAAWWPKLAPGARLLGDDYADFEGVARAADEFAAANGLDLEVHAGTFILHHP